jgi:phosphatidylserine/phosphatidylglycerophosphate/cardiolipin synthase-like enzyme
MLGVLLVFLAAPPSAGECTNPAHAPDSVLTLARDLDRVSEPQLPPCASDLFKGIFAATKDVAGEGTVPRGLIATSGNAASPDVLVRGPKIFRGIGDLIESANVEANLQTWNWHPGSRVSREVTSALGRLEKRRRSAGAAGEPVVVRLLVNYAPIASREMMTGLASEIEALKLDPKLVRVEIGGHHHAFLGANHSKDVTVDGAKAIVMGPNVTTDNDLDTDYFDAGYRLEGEVAGALREDFADAWSKSFVWTCGTEKVNRTVRRATTADDRTPESCWQKPAPLSPLPVAAAPGCAPMLVATRPANGIPWESDDHGNPQAQAFFGALAVAKTRIRMQTPNLNEPILRHALVQAARQGIKVELVLSKKYEEFTESLPTRGGTNDDSVELLYELAREAGVKKPCEMLAVRWFSNDGATPVEENGPPTSHAKYLSIDGQVVVVGSANMDIQSWRNSREVNVVVDSAETTAAWDRQVFEPSFAGGVPAACR